jgi:hypothetical protein
MLMLTPARADPVELERELQDAKSGAGASSNRFSQARKDRVNVIYSASSSLSSIDPS